MHDVSSQLDPGPILQTAFGFWSSKVLLTAVEFGVFTNLVVAVSPAPNSARNLACTRAALAISSTRSSR